MVLAAASVVVVGACVVVGASVVVAADGDGEQPTGKACERFKVACSYQPPRSFWIRTKQYAPAPITCGICGQKFQPQVAGRQ